MAFSGCRLRSYDTDATIYVFESTVRCTNVCGSLGSEDGISIRMEICDMVFSEERL